MKLIATLLIPIRTVSEGNSTEHWAIKHARHKKQKRAVTICFSGKAKHDVLAAGLPLHIIITRIAPRSLDETENLPMAVKHIKDFIADIIRPGYQMGRSDEGCGLEWQVKQEKGQPKEYAIKIEFYKD